MKFRPKVKIKKQNNVVTSILIDGEEWAPFLTDFRISCTNEYNTELTLDIPCSEIEITDTYT